MIDRLLARLERIARGPDEAASVAARFVLGEVDADEVDRCRDPRCLAHRP